MNTLVIDFETYYDKDYSLSKITTQEYVKSPLFKVHGVGIKVNNNLAAWISATKINIKALLQRLIKHDTIIICHNAAFDITILEWHYGIKASRTLCTLSLSRAVIGGALRSHSLASVAEYLLHEPKGTFLAEVMGVRDLSPEQDKKLGAYCIKDTNLCYGIYTRLIPYLSETEQLAQQWVTRAYTRPSLCLDLRRLETHLENTKKQKAEALAKAGLDNRDMLMSNDQLAKALYDLGVNPPTKKSKATGKDTWAFAKTDVDFQELLEHGNPQVQALVAARLECKSTIEETRTERFIQNQKYGPWCVGLKYGATITQRLSGDGGDNPQNLRRGGELRKAIVAPEGYTIVAGDLKQIELRMSMMVACISRALRGLVAESEQEALNILAAGGDLYQSFGDEIGIVRQAGKACLLGNGYGQGFVKFNAELSSKYGIHQEFRESKVIVDAYRAKYDGIVECWAECENILLPLSNCESGELWGGLFTYGPHPVTGAPSIKGPNGLYIQYPELHWGYDEKTNREQWMYVSYGKKYKIYGSALFGHLIQHLARCVIMTQLVELDKYIPVALQIHDEMVAVVKKATAHIAVKIVNKIMTTKVPWLPDLPLAAEVSYSRSYGDMK